MTTLVYADLAAEIKERLELIKEVLEDGFTIYHEDIEGTIGHLSLEFRMCEVPIDQMAKVIAAITPLIPEGLIAAVCVVQHGVAIQIFMPDI